MPAAEVQIPVQIGPNQPDATAQIVSTMMQLRLPSFGEYSIHLAVDGKQEASTPLYVRQLIIPPHPQKPI